MGNCLICFLNGLTVGFKKALLTSGSLDQAERLCYIMSMRTKGELVGKKKSHKMIFMRLWLPHIKMGWKKITRIGPFLSVLKSNCFQKQHDIDLGFMIWWQLAPACQGMCEMWLVQTKICCQAKRHTRFWRLSRKKESQRAPWSFFNSDFQPTWYFGSITLNKVCF